MSVPLRKSELLDRVLAAIESSGWQALVVERNHPFLLRVFKRDEQGFLNLRLYIWNCTHGGKHRAEDEYRVQLTGVVPAAEKGETTLLLGWHEGYRVFVGFDIRKHKGQASASPSIQVKEGSLLNAHNHAFAAYDRANGEIAVCFRPEFIVSYAGNLAKLHGLSVKDKAEVKILNAVDEVGEDEIEATIRNTERREVLASIKRKYREHDFRQRVLSAYASTCAFCGMQLKLVDAAHIVPVASDSSTDETTNGIALCSLHHRAYDQNLVNFDERYRIEVSDASVSELNKHNLAGGLVDFQAGLKSAIILPADKRDYPASVNIRNSRKVRMWIL
ncbi:HNH endonuclease [Candidatus Sumerlaeota bacterium]|nr:HNH endonuclease [Candidatus Sumerlaeota bacterium]